MKLSYFPLIVFCYFFLNPLLLAQPQPCEEPPTMTSFCADACIICDIDGFTGRHEANIVGQAPPGFAGECTFVAHNMQWIAFIAGSVNLSVQLQVSNCQSGLGLEFGLYRGIDCQNFKRISNCFGGAAGIIGPGQSGTITNNEPLVIGQYYFIVMDGGLGDNCDWTFNVVSGSTKVEPLTTSGMILGPDRACPNVSSTYVNVNTETGGTLFEWTLNGSAIGDINTDSVNIDWQQTGTYDLCVKVANACDEAPPVCQTILIEEIPLTNLIEVICENECFEVGGMSLCESGNYNFNLPTPAGCDSIVDLNLTVLESPLTILDLTICDGDSILIGNNYYQTNGQFTENLLTSIGCDSTINLDLSTIICQIEGNSMITPVNCAGASTGIIDFSISNGTPPFNYIYERVGGSPTGNGLISSLTDDQTISNLPTGVYTIFITDNFNNALILIAEVPEPNPLSIFTTVSDFNGVNVTCANVNDGFIMVTANGGTSPYSYSWNTGDLSSNINDLAPGDYTIQVMDANGCNLQETNTLTSPPPISLVVNFTDPNCDGFDTGIVSADTVSGGSPPYRYHLLDTTFVETPVFAGLLEGTYTLTVRDANGCIESQTDDIFAPLIPIVDLGKDTTIELSDQTRLHAFSSVFADSIIWSPNIYLSCDDCLTPIAMPLENTTYIVSVASEDGCFSSDSIFIEVLKIRDVYIPNAFSPNGDGVNDEFTVYGGPEVERVKSLSVFNRWGALVYQMNDFPANDNSKGWKGDFKEQLVDENVYVYLAEVDFIDGVTVLYKGDITVVR